MGGLCRQNESAAAQPAAGNRPAPADDGAQALGSPAPWHYRHSRAAGGSLLALQHFPPCYPLPFPVLSPVLACKGTPVPPEDDGVPPQVAGDMERPRSAVDLIQEDFPRTPSPVFPGLGSSDAAVREAAAAAYAQLQGAQTLSQTLHRPGSADPAPFDHNRAAVDRLEVCSCNIRWVLRAGPWRAAGLGGHRPSLARWLPVGSGGVA